MPIAPIGSSLPPVPNARVRDPRCRSAAPLGRSLGDGSRGTAMPGRWHEQASGREEGRRLARSCTSLGFGASVGPREATTRTAVRAIRAI
ncbi:hypothetical protein N8152_02940, partial [bacterium]|nr:hypothetical protein [bacterium]